MKKSFFQRAVKRRTTQNLKVSVLHGLNYFSIVDSLIILIFAKLSGHDYGSSLFPLPRLRGRGLEPAPAKAGGEGVPCRFYFAHLSKWGSIQPRDRTCIEAAHKDDRISQTYHRALIHLRQVLSKIEKF